MGTKSTRYPDNEFDAAITPIKETSADSFGGGDFKTSDGWNVARFVDIGRVDAEGPRSVMRDKEYGVRPKFANLHHDQVLYRHFANPAGPGSGPGETVVGPGVIGPDGVVPVGIPGGAGGAGEVETSSWNVDSTEVGFEISTVSDFHGIHKSKPDWNPSHVNSPNRSGLLISRRELEDEDKHFDLARRYFSRTVDIMVPISTQDIDLNRTTFGKTPTPGGPDDTPTPPGGGGVVPPELPPDVPTGVPGPGATGTVFFRESRPGDPIPQLKEFAGFPVPIGIPGATGGGPIPGGIPPIGIPEGDTGGNAGGAFFALNRSTNKYKEGVHKSHWNITPTDNPVDFELDQKNEHDGGPGDHGFGPHDYIEGMPDIIKDPKPPENHFQGGWMYDGKQDVLAQIHDIIGIDAIENASAELPRYLNRFKQRVGIPFIRHDAHFQRIADDD